MLLLLNTIFNLKLNFRLKINPKMCTFKTGENLSKTFGNPVYMYRVAKKPQSLEFDNLGYKA